LAGLVSFELPIGLIEGTKNCIGGRSNNAAPGVAEALLDLKKAKSVNTLRDGGSGDSYDYTDCIVSSDPIGNRFAVKFVPDVLHCLDETVFVQVPRICLVSGIPQNCGDEVAAPAVFILATTGKVLVSKFLDVLLRYVRNQIVSVFDFDKCLV
jgi:hypothetical protein